MSERAKSDVTLPHPPTEFESSPMAMKNFLRASRADGESAYVLWKEWLNWRQEEGVNDITEDSLQEELATKVAFWQGKNKKGRPCLLVTGRLNNPALRVGSGKDFQKFMIHTVETGCQLADEMGEDKVCVIYDRRGLEFQHIDGWLHQGCTRLIAALQRWYAHRLETLYVIHVNTFFWILYHVFFRPIFGLFVGNHIVVITNPADILDYFDEEQLPPGFVERGVTLDPAPENVTGNDEPEGDSNLAATVTSGDHIAPERSTIADDDRS